MPTLFDPIRVGRMALSNRVAMAPLTRNRSPGAVPPAITATYYAQRASAGLLVTEGTAISQPDDCPACTSDNMVVRYHMTELVPDES